MTTKNFYLPILAIFIGAVLLSSCKKEGCTDSTATNYNSEADKDDGSCEHPEENNTTNTNASSSPQFKGEFNGTAFSYLNLYNAYTSDGSVATDGNPSTFIYSFILMNSDLNDIVEVTKGTLTVPDGFYPSNDEFDDFFPLGTSEFDATLSNGVVISYTDDSGNLWSSALGSADQTGASFEIVDRVVTEYAGDHVVKVKIEANCTLYNQTGGSQALEKAIIIGTFANI